MAKRNSIVALAFFLLFIAGCTLSVDTRILDFGSDKTTETFTLMVDTPLEWSITCSKSWVSVSPDSGHVEGTHSITVTVDRTGLENGIYTALLHTSTNPPSPCSDVLVKMTVVRPPVPDEGISLFKPVNGDSWHVGSPQVIEWVSAAELKNDRVKIEIIGDTLSSGEPILDIDTENTGSYKINSLGKDTLDNHTLWTTPLLKGRVIISVTNPTGVWMDEAELTFPITLRILYNKILTAGGLDSDLDGLQDSIEEFLGTDPYSNDSDGDGIHDYNEIFGFGYFNDSALIPDSNGDGVMDFNDADYNDEDLYGWLHTDNDADGIPNYLEYYGYTYDWMRDSYELWDGKSLDQPYFKTDPQQPSTDQDPYDDAMETSGVLMDVSVREPGSMPMVPAYPNIVIRLEGYDVTLNQDITISEGESLGKDTNWSRSTTKETSRTSEKFWEAGASVTQGFEYGTAGFTGSTEITVHASGGGRRANTNTTASTRSTGGSITAESNWQKATTTNPTDAARIKLFLKVYNHGTSAASNIIPTFTLKIGGMNIATFEQGNAQINILEPGGVYPSQMGTYWVIDSIDTGTGVAPISLTLDELRALECGAPVSIVMTQMLADVMLMNNDGHWESVGDWGEYIARCDAVCSNIYLDIGDGSFIHYLLYADDSPTSPQVTFRDALMWVAGGSNTEDDNIITYFDRFGKTQKLSLQDWDFNLDLETLSKNSFILSDSKNLLPPSPDYNLANLVLGPDTVIVGKPPRSYHSDENSPVVHYAYLDEQIDTVRVCASDYSGIEKVTFQPTSSSAPQEMEELVFNSGIYTLEIDSSYISTGTEKVTVYSYDPDALPTFVAVEKVVYPERTPIPPTIDTVYFTLYNHLLRAHVTGNAEYPVTSVSVYHHLIEPDGEQEMTPSTLWWNDMNGYQTYLANIDQYNYHGLTIIAVAEGYGDTVYTAYELTADDIIKDGYAGDIGMIVDYRRNSDDDYSCAFGCFIDCPYGDDFMQVTIGPERTEWRIAQLDLDTDNYGLYRDRKWGGPDRSYNWYNADWNHEWDPQHPYDLWLLQHWGLSLYFKGEYCIYDGVKSFQEIDRTEVERFVVECSLTEPYIPVPLTAEDLPVIFIMETNQGRYAKVRLEDLNALINQQYENDCNIFGYNCSHCTWIQHQLDIRYVTFANEICGDGVDNDLNSLIDCDDQPECSDDPACVEEMCSDGIDNDADGSIDCYDPDCDAFLPCQTHEYHCSDTLDNDTDSLTDCDDPDCSRNPLCPEVNCSDGEDNDWDGYTDCGDPDCCPESGCNNETVCCGDGVDNDGDTFIDCDDQDCYSDFRCPEIACSDSLDNDGDSFIDCLDPDCFGNPVCLKETFCNDRIDNDDDGFTDCADTDCVGDTSCCYPECTCTDRIDNDGDGNTDCDDVDCIGDPLCIGEIVCDDGIDNDGDLFIDCADLDCIGHINCCYPECDCNDNIDNDGDSFIDCSDQDCMDPVDICYPEADCNDVIDNDGDGFIDCNDHDCDLDPACTS